MTTSVLIGALGQPGDRWRRDQWGRYLILPPGATKPVGYTRATTVAETLDEGWGLPDWKATMACCGAIMRPGLAARWESLLARYQGRPWYAGDDVKAECKQLVQECAAVGGANDRSELGTSLHELTAWLDSGKEITHLSFDMQMALEVYQRTLADAGVKILPGYIERTVVLDVLRIAGTFDRLVQIPGFDKPLIADLKTGADLSYAWRSICVQLAIYAGAACFYAQGAAPDGSEDVREPMPDIDRENALVIWLNPVDNTCTLFIVDLTAGWEALEHSLWVREWREQDNLVEPYVPGHPWPRYERQVPLAEALERSLRALGVSIDNEETQPLIVNDQPSYTLQLRAWLQERIEDIGRHQNAREDLLNEWPEGVPPLLQASDHTPEQLAAIERAIDRVERRHEMPFPAERPTPDAMGLILHMFPNTVEVQAPDQPNNPEGAA